MSPMQPVIRSLYRAVFRLAKQCDKQPCFKLSLENHSACVFSGRSWKEGIQLPVQAYRIFCDELNSAMGGARFYAPAFSACQAVRGAFRTPVNEKDLPARVDAALFALKKVSKDIQKLKKHLRLLPVEYEPPKKPAVQLARNTPVQEGDILLSHPMLGLRRSDRWAVVLVLCSFAEGGFMGVNLNRPTDVRLIDYWKAIQHYIPEKVDIDPSIHQLPIHLGGPLPNMAAVQVHETPDCYHGTWFDLWVRSAERLPSFSEKVVAGEWKTEDFKIYDGVFSWDKGQLEGEIKRNYWFHVRLSGATAIRNLWKANGLLAGNPSITGRQVVRRIPTDSSDHDDHHECSDTDDALDDSGICGDLTDSSPAVAMPRIYGAPGSPIDPLVTLLEVTEDCEARKAWDRFMLELGGEYAHFTEVPLDFSKLFPSPYL
eukprot:Rmarinus@m.436